MEIIFGIFIGLLVLLGIGAVIPKRHDPIERWRDDGAHGNPPGTED